eukprot:scaffold2369_cov202-Prasinococcus_capsulatus_cf.AAC.2
MGAGSAVACVVTSASESGLSARLAMFAIELPSWVCSGATDGEEPEFKNMCSIPILLPDFRRVPSGQSS